ncbi:MAG: hypothetical protein U5L10_03395 [Candidatus Moranbacteria bacterium]|nr:hypothetical protein [Candidatus Moranbacteria bacterium]
MKRIITSLSLVAVATAVVILGGTGAWWTDEATSHNTSFKSGSMDLKLWGKKANGSGDEEWRGEVGQTWDYENMSPGGNPDGGVLKLKNAGTTKADWLKLATTTDPQPAIMDETMRITKLDYAGKNLLEGGAGANLYEYKAPASETCNVIVNNNDGDSSTPNTIQDGINQASEGDLICVGGDSYTESVDVNERSLTLAALGSAGDVSLEGKFNVISDGVTVKGFEITNTKAGTEKEGIFVHNMSDIFDNDLSVVIEYNVINGVSDTDETPTTVEGIHVKEYDGNGWLDDVVIRNNEIKNIKSQEKGANGIKLQADLRKVTVENNTFEDIQGAWTYGITLTYSSGETGYPRSVAVNDNHFNLTNAIAVGLDDADGKEVTVNRNNFIGSGVTVANINPNQDEHPNKELDATNNWWGDFDPSDQVYGDVDYSNPAGAAFAGFVNGNDQNGNGFADLEDLHKEDVVVEEPKLDEGVQELDLRVQMDGPTSTNDHQEGTVGIDMEITMGQGPVQ